MGGFLQFFYSVVFLQPTVFLLPFGPPILALSVKNKNTPHNTGTHPTTRSPKKHTQQHEEVHVSVLSLNKYTPFGKGVPL
jgi:hypothetical protein